MKFKLETSLLMAAAVSLGLALPQAARADYLVQKTKTMESTSVAPGMTEYKYRSLSSSVPESYRETVLTDRPVVIEKTREKTVEKEVTTQRLPALRNRTRKSSRRTRKATSYHRQIRTASKRPRELSRATVIEKTKTVEKPIVVERPVIVNRQVEKIVEKPVVVETRVEKTIEKPVYIDRIIEKPVYRDRIIEKHISVERPVIIEQEPGTVYEEKSVSIDSF